MNLFWLCLALTLIFFICCVKAKIATDKDNSEFCNYANNGTTFITAVTGSGALINSFFNEPVDYYITYGTTPGIYTTNTTILENQSINTPINIHLTGLTENTRYYYQPYIRRNATSEDYCAFQDERNFTTEKPSGSSFSFVHVTDTHLNAVFYKLPASEEGQISYFNTASQIRSINPDFVIDTGDSTGMVGNGGGGVDNQEEAYTQWSRIRNLYSYTLPIPFYFSLGNHEGESDLIGRDGYTQERMNWSTHARLKYFPQPDNSTYPYGGNNETRDKNAAGDYFQDYGRPLEDYYAFDWGDATFVVLDTYRYTENLTEPLSPNFWSLGKEQFEWLNQTLATSTKKWKFVFGHHILGGGNSTKTPPQGDYNYGDGGGNYSQTGNESYGQVAINPLMERYNAQFYIYGHVHFFAHDWANWSLYNRTNYVNYVAGGTPSQKLKEVGSRYDLYDNEIIEWGYTQYTVTPNNVTFSYVNISDGSILYTYTLNNTSPRISTSYTNNTAITSNITFQYLDDEYDNAKNCSLFINGVQKYTGFNLMNGTSVSNNLTSLGLTNGQSFNWYVNCSDGTLDNQTIAFTSTAAFPDEMPNTLPKTRIISSLNQPHNPEIINFQQ